MRLLVACNQCKRQFDASKLKLGDKFRCRCGVVITVPEPKGHDAAVVCCAHCGAPRKDGALACEFCGADFTLHERDLDTVCPHCCARVSHHAKFCHFCGAAITSESMAGDESKLVCPSCGSNHFLRSRAWADVSLMECNCCAGVWLESNSFRHLTDDAAAGGLNSEGHNWPKTARPAEVENSAPPRSVRYRPCAVCGQLMVRQQYGRQSGVILDLCRFHGIWFDADELPRILDWIRSGGLARANSYEAQKESEEMIFRRSQAGNFGTRAPFSDPLGPASANDAPLGLIFDSLSRWFFGL